MKYLKLGHTGLDVSRICLGCMTYGVPERGNHPWTLNEEKSRPLIRRALELGVNFFDTANVYSDGTSEEILGRAIRDFSARDDVVIATKVHGRMRPGPNGAGLSRRAIMGELENSLRRLDMDYVDLYQIHRWDDATPIEETLEALHDVVKAGKVRYIGASSMFSWQFATALNLQKQHGWSRFITMQNYYNLIYREEEREMMPLCEAERVGVLPWSPLARGRLTRDWDESSYRKETDEFGKTLYERTAEADRIIVERVAALSVKRSVPRAQIALAWVLAKSFVTAPIIGATKESHLEDAVAALDVSLTSEEIVFLEETYVPHAVTGFV